MIPYDQRGHAERALDRSVRFLRGSPTENPTQILSIESFGMGQLIGAGLLEPETTEASLIEAGVAAGIEESEARVTVKSGLWAGEKRPRQPRDWAPRELVEQPWKKPTPCQDHLNEVQPDGQFIGTLWPKRTKPEKGSQFSFSFPQFVKLLSNPPEPQRGKDEQAQWTLSTFKDNHRKAETFLKAHGLVLDFESPTLEELKALFGRWTFVAHTTWSHTPEQPHWRVFIPFQRPVNAEEYRELVRWAALQHDGVNPSCTCAVAHYQPSRTQHFQFAYNHEAVFNPDEALEAIPRLMATRESQSTLERLQLNSFAFECLQTLVDRWDGSERPIALPEDWAQLTALLDGGFWPGLTAIQGETGIGKSQFALQAAFHAARQGVPVGYLGPALDRLGVFCRILGILTRTPWSRFFHGASGARDGGLPLIDEFKQHWKTLRLLPLFFEPGPVQGIQAADLAAMARRIRTVYPEGNAMLVLDSLQYLSGEKRDSPERRFTRALRTSRALAREYNLAVLLVSDLECSEVSSLADISLLLSREPSTNKTPQGAALVRISCTKLRARIPTWTQLAFDGSYWGKVPN